MTAHRRQAALLYLEMLAAAEGWRGRLELAAAIGRATGSLVTRGRGALHVTRPVILRLGGIRWWVPPRDNSFASSRPGRDNNSVLPALERCLAGRPKGVVIDVGANLGFVTLPLARAHPEMRFVAIEPIPWLADALQRSAQLNDITNVTVIGRAIADSTHVRLLIPVVGGVRLSTLSSSGGRRDREGAGEAVENLDVAAVGLDQLLGELAVPPSDVACIKVDVEGAEAAVLATGPGVLAHRPPVAFECWSEVHRADVEAVLRRSGYGTFRPLDTQNILGTA